MGVKMSPRLIALIASNMCRSRARKFNETQLILSYC